MTQTTRVPLMMLEMIPSGLYAVRPDPGTPYTFLRLSRPTYGRRKGMVIVQTQHSEQLTDRWFWNPANQDPVTAVRSYTNWTFNGQTIEELMLLMIANSRAAGRAYAAEMRKCHYCGKKLTDERSRWYGFGPECEKRAEAEKDEIDDENEGTYEYLVATQAVIYLDWLSTNHTPEV